MSPTINIKDEPIDEGYDAALLPQGSIRQIKEELEHQEVGGRSKRHMRPLMEMNTVDSSFPSDKMCLLVLGGAEDQLCVLCRGREHLCVSYT